jgi:hypothetical protein
MTTMNHPLPDELLFEPDGHLTETALTVIADGELDLVSPTALGHLDGCDACSHRLGEAALLSVAASEALVLTMGPQAAPNPRPAEPAVAARAPIVAGPAAITVGAVKVRRPLPVWAIAAALVVSAVTAGPALVDALRGVPSTVAGAVTTMPFLFKVASTFLRVPLENGSLALVVRCASAVMLAAIGLQVARMAARQSSWQQGGV